MARYFYTSLGLRPIVIDGRTYKPDLVSAQRDGTIVAESEQEVADLLSQVGRGLSEISQGEYDQLQAQKKTTHSSGRLSSSPPAPRAVAQQPSRLPVTLEDKQGVAYAESDPKPASKQEEPKPETTIESLKTVGRVASPHPVENEKRVGGSAKKGGKK